MNKLNLAQLLDYINPSALTYQEWVDVGMALCHEGYPADVWDNWSRQDAARYHEGECMRKWESFRGNPRPITGATITQMAKNRGWKPRGMTGGRALDWNDEISRDEEDVIIDRHYLEGMEIQQPGKDWSPAKDMIRYLRAVFHADDIIGYVNETWEKDGRWIPANKGHWSRTAGEIITSLEKYGDDIGNTLGDYNEKGGAWIRINPLDGKGVKNENVADFRYTLIESDSLPLETQNEILRKLELPIAALVYSGGKSLHAIVHVDAKNYEEYRQRVDFLYKICQKNGFVIDSGNRNPSRLSRLPGIYRNGKKQFLIDTNIGQPDYHEWREWFDETNDDLPPKDNLGEEWDRIPPYPPCLIENVLRKGDKLLLAGPSKAGKSFALIELCIAIAEGRSWMGFPCAKGKIWYINLELNRTSCLHRFQDIYKALGIPPTHIHDIDIWNLRGKSIPMDKLAPKLIWRAKKENYTAIVIDPIYKVITGDENSASDMAAFCNQFDKVCRELGCAVIYCHHHSKGGQGMKKSMDRASGSGVFARDPDAILDMIQLRTENAPGDKTTAWRITGTLREFEPFDPVNVYFHWPIHTLDDSGMLGMAAEEGDLSTIREDGRKAGVKARQEKSKSKKESLPMAFDAVNVNGSASLEDMAAYLSTSVRTVRRYLEDSGEFKIKNSFVVPL